MRKIEKTIITTIILLLALVSITSIASSAGPNYMGFYTADPHVTVTDSFSTIAWVDVNSQIDTAAIDNLTYLTAGRLHYTSTAQGDLFPGTLIWMTPEANGVIDNTNGYAYPIVWANTGSVNNVNKTLATITWYANSCGIATLTITKGGTAYGGIDPGTTKLPYTIYVHPKAPTDFSATGVSENQIDLTWTKQTGMDKTLIRWRADTYPTSVTDGNELYNDTGTSTSHTGLNPSDQIFYSAWGWSDAGFYSLTYQSDDGVTLGGNLPPYTPSNPLPANDATNIEPSSDFVITWDGGDPDAGDLVNYKLHWGTSSDPPFMGTIGSYDYTPISFTIVGFITGYETTYYWKIIAEDEHGATSSGPVWNFTTRPENFPPYEPSNPSPSNGATGVDINADLSWTGGDPDVGDTVKYDVYFGATSPPNTKVSANQSSTTYDPGQLAYSTDYYWQIIAWDNHGASSSGPIWSFTTQGAPSPPSNGGTTPAPVADANGPYYEPLEDGVAEVTFNGTGSYGSITSYSWDFGDNTTGTGVSPTHGYTALGNFTVNLTVTGPGGSNKDQTFAIISEEPNLPPIAPVVSGPQAGSKNTDYDYTAVSTDEDNDTLQYIFDWGDGTNSTSDFVANGTAATISHNWSTWGFYTIKVNASDNKTYSGSTEYVVLIDVLYVKNIGYLIDTNSNGTYDKFYSNETLEQTSVEKLANGSYLINSDNDSEWDYIYDSETDALSAYVPPSEPEKEEDYALWYALLIGMLLAILILIIIFLVTKKKKKKPKKKPEKPKK